MARIAQRFEFIGDNLRSVLRSVSGAEQISIIVWISTFATIASIFTIGFPWKFPTEALGVWFVGLIELKVLDPLFLQVMTAMTVAVLFAMFYIVGHPAGENRNRAHQLFRIFRLFFISSAIVAAFLSLTWVLSEFLLKSAYGLGRPQRITNDLTDSIAGSITQNTGDMPSGYAFRQTLLLNATFLLIFALHRKMVFKSEIIYGILSCAISVVTFWILFARIATGHHSPVGVAAGIVWGISIFWLMLLLFSTRSQIALQTSHISFIATWTILLLFLYTGQGERVIGGLIVTIIAGILWAFAYHKRRLSEELPGQQSTEIPEDQKSGESQDG